MLKVRLFGTGEAFYGDRPLAGFPSQQPHLLLAYLLLNSTRPHLRDQLAGIFWGDYPSTSARKYLRNSLWKLRQMFEAAGAQLDDYLLVNDDSISFIHTAPYWLDVEVFESVIEGCRDVLGQYLTLQQASQLEQVVDLYTDELLAGTYCEWCLYARERLGLAYLRALGKLMVFHEIHQNYERGLYYGEKVLARDNTREKVYMNMMRLYWLLGDRAGALAQYNRCEQILQDELGVAPMKETTMIYHLILQNRFEPEDARWGRFIRSGQDPNLHLLAEKAMARLQNLQEMLEETHSELRYIKQLLQVQLRSAEQS